MSDYLSRFTFYDIVGYLLPGLVGVCAVCLGLSVIDTKWRIPEPNESMQWIILLIISYFTGHAFQGLSVRLCKRGRIRDITAREISPVMMQMVERALRYYNFEESSIERQLEAIDALKIDSTNREMFVARQGFFRGASLALLVLGVITLCAYVFNRPSESLFIHLDRNMSGFTSCASFGMALLFVKRYKDFVRHELEHTVAKIICDINQKKDK
jgi:hypothetical protein